MSVLLCLAITQVRIPSLTEHLCPATLTTTLPSIQPLASILLNDTILLRHIYCPHSSLYKLHFGATGFLLDSWTLRMGLTGCPKMVVGNFHYSLPNNPDERSSQLLHGKSLKSRTTIVTQSVIPMSILWHVTAQSIQGQDMGWVTQFNFWQRLHLSFVQHIQPVSILGLRLTFSNRLTRVVSPLPCSTWRRQIQSQSFRSFLACDNSKISATPMTPV